MTRDWPIAVRRARRADKAQIVRFAVELGDHPDYIPDVLDDWLAATDGVVLVAEVGSPGVGVEPCDAEGEALPVGQVVAMSRVTMLSDTDGWLEGIRVDPRVRGMDVGTDLQVAELHWLAAHGATAVRYMRAEANVGSKNLGARHGLVEIGRWRAYGRESTEPLSTDVRERVDRMGKAAPDAWERVRRQPMLAATHGLYEWRPWSFQKLTQERFRKHVERGEALTITKGEGWAVAIVNRPWLDVEGEIRLAFLAGDGEAVLDLLVWLGRPQIRLPDPNPPLLAGMEEQFLEEGYAPWPTTAVIVERPIAARHPIPDVDPSRLVLLDEPSRLAEAPALDQAGHGSRY